MKRTRAGLGLIVFAVALWSAGRPPEVRFAKHTLDLGASETAALADIDGDGKPDIISGEFWYRAPDWTPHRFRDIEFTENYVDDFSDLPLDVDGDGQIDIVSCGWFGKYVAWWRNPGKGRGAWQEHPIDKGYPVEFAFLVDLDNDGKAREVLPQFGDERAALAWYEPVKGEFVKHVASPKGYGHGIGVGDVNRDGRNDILTPKGWLEAPADPRKGDWVFHPDWNLPSTGFLHVLDIDGDGKNDVVTSLAHDYGVIWLRHGEGSQWTKQVIDDSWSQPHALTLADLNGDGQPDLLTGKRYMAHNGRDPGEREPLGVYWYEYRRGPDRKVTWVRHLIDYGTRTGGGMQIPAADIDGDGDVDFVAPGKGGLFLFENLTRGARSARENVPSSASRR